MNLNIIYSLFILGLLLSCEPKTTENTSGQPPKSDGISADTNKSKGNNSFQISPEPGTGFQSGNVSSAINSVEPVNNPAHGQPGHRCDIPVGKPITGPAPVVNPGTNPTSQPVINSQFPAQGNSGTGTNPPHGQPGHDCSKPVGSALNK